MIKRKCILKAAFFVAFSLLLIYSLALTIHFNVPGKILSAVRYSRITKLQDESNYLANIFYREITSFYEYYSNTKTNIVMIGDSITYRVHWNELLGRNDIINRGIGSDTTLGVLSRLEEICNRKPSIAFIMIGINDLAKGFPIQEVFENYRNIVKILRENEIEVIIQSTLFTRDNRSNINEKVNELNALLSNYSVEQSIQYIDLNNLLSDSNKLKEEYTIDGVHLLGGAYNIWKKEIQKYL